MSIATLPPGVDRLASGRYRARAAYGGRRSSRTFTTPQAASRWRLDAIDAMRAGKDAPGPPPPPAPPVRAVTVLDVIRSFGAGMEAGTVRNRAGGLYKPSVSRRMESALRIHVVPRVGHYPIAGLTRRDVQRLVDELAAEKTPETARKAVNALSVALRVAERDGTIDRNPAHDIAVPQDGAGERPIRVITPEETDAILAAAVADDVRMKRSLASPLLSLAFGTGLRSGELLGLVWGPDGLDLESNVVRVRRSVDRVRDEDGLFPIVAPKTRASIRDVPLDPADARVLRLHRLASGRPEDGALVFADEDGHTLNAVGALRHIWARVVGAARITVKVKGEDTEVPLPGEPPRLHDARHAWAVVMLRAGVAPPALAKLGGWSDVGIIHRRYGKHALPDELEGAGEALGRWRDARRARL